MRPAFLDDLDIADDFYSLPRKTFLSNYPTISVEDYAKAVNYVDYHEKQCALIQEAIESQREKTLSWGEVAEKSNYFYKNGKKYGLLREFKENGIC